MAERPRFGIDTPQRIRQTQADQSAAMFPGGEDLPLFSGTPIPAIERPFVPEDHSMKQALLPGMPAIDYDSVLAMDRARRQRGRSRAVIPPGEDIFIAPMLGTSYAAQEGAEPVQQREASPLPVVKPERRRSASQQKEQLHPLREALAPYLDFPTLRQLAAKGEDLRACLKSLSRTQQQFASA